MATRTNAGRPLRFGVAALSLLAALVALLPQAEAARVPEWSEHRLLAIDGDLVVFGDGSDLLLPGTGATEDADAKGSGSAGAGSGYALIRDTAHYRGTYELRIVPGGGIDRVRSDVAAAAQAASMTTGVSVTLSSAAGDFSPEAGEIDVAVRTSSPCAGAWLACGGPTLVGDEIRSGRIWVHPKLLDRAPHEIRNTIFHEIGHTLGLAHYSGAESDGYQVMHPTRFDAPTYRQGDRAGLAAVVANRPPMSGALLGLWYRAGSFDLDLRIDRIDPGAVVRVTVDGDTVSETVATAGRHIHRAPGPGGPQRLCVSLVSSRMRTVLRCLDVTAPANPFGSLDRVQLTDLGVRLTGWAIDPQTAAPIDVRVVASVLSLDHRADEYRPDVAAAHAGYGPNHGFVIDRIVPPGRQRVCAYARNEGVGTDVLLGCAIVDVPWP